MDPKIIKQLNETREAFKQRFDQAKLLNAKDRKILYKNWRADIGDIAARETAMFVESYLKGDNPKTAKGIKWEKINDAYEELDLFDMKRKGLI
jgi:hypothetical protein